MAGAARRCSNALGAMTRGDEPRGTGDGARGTPPLFQASRPPASRAGRVILAIVGLTLVALGVGFAARSRSTRKAAPAATIARPAPTPIEVPEGAMVQVAGGSFDMGSDDGEPDERPVTRVTVAPFEIDTTEVTVAAYTKCVTAGKCAAPDTGMYCNWRTPGLDAHPINCIDFAEAGRYCTFVGKRLPTEPEWEIAARGLDGRKYPWRDGPPADNLCWSGDGNDQGRGNRQGTCPVASYPAGASPSGALDMAGNVWEWTASPHCPYSTPGCGSDRFVIRGGAWNNLDPAYVRAQDRARESPKARPDNVGVRCARSP